VKPKMPKIRKRVEASFDGNREAPFLSDLCVGLLARQKESWPYLRDGHAGLDAALTREISADGYSVKLQFNPRRIVSSTAAVDPESLNRRNCFLCIESLPEEQLRILYRGNHLILCNPAPIFQRHYTIASRLHVPQAVEKDLDAFLLLAEDFGPGWSVFYNGPRCGASAPDHLHFQAAPAGVMPMENEIGKEKNRVPIGRAGNVSVLASVGLGRPIITVEGGMRKDVENALLTVMGALREIAMTPDEPMMNLLCSHDGAKWRVLLFPRRRHRPEAYYREGDNRILISPGAVDMAGLIITPVEKDFHALNAEEIGRIFREVSLDGDSFARFVFMLSERLHTGG
jgi:hypothetical protein